MSYVTDAFGLVSSSDASGVTFGFAGQFGGSQDSEDGFVLMGHRYYDPGAGRFLTRDPASYDGGINLYAYTANNPINSIDPMGTSAFSDWYWGGMGGLSKLTDAYLLNGSVSNLGTVTGEYEGGCASGWDVAWAGAKVAGNTVMLVAPGGGEVKAAETGLRVVEEANAAKNGFVAAKDLDALSAAGRAADRGGLSQAGRGLAKHGGRTGSIFPGAKGNPSAINDAGQEIVDDILTTPGNKVYPHSNGGGFDIHAPDGRGLRYNGSGGLQGFLEPRLK